MARTYQGIYKPNNPEKYVGDVNNIVFRSSWERMVAKWLDANPDVEKWASEELVIPYICRTDNREHRYFPDFLVKFKSGKTLLIEVKPKHQCSPPVQKKGQRQSVLIEALSTYAKNASKWEAAEEYCKRKGWSFAIFTEDTLKAMGMKFPSRFKK